MTLWTVACQVSLSIGFSRQEYCSGFPCPSPADVSWCCCSVTKSCLTLWNPMDGSMTGFPVLHYFPEFAQTFMSTESVMSSNHPVLFRPLLLLPSIFPSIKVYSNESALAKILELQYQSFQASRSFLMNQLFASGGLSIEASASASVLPMNIQG